MKTLLDQYQKQLKWRNWERVLDKLPNLDGKTVFDLGCAHGDISFQLSKKGALVHGFDSNSDFIGYARGRSIKNASFELKDLTKFGEDHRETADGIWASFVVAYFADLDSIFKHWRTLLKNDGWIAVTEMTGLLDHEPLSKEFRDKIRDFYQNSLDNNGYDFRSGSKIGDALSRTGFRVVDSFEVDDRELSFDGPADDHIKKAWGNRLDRMGGFKRFLGSDFLKFKEAFMNSIADPNHKSDCRVLFYLAKL